MFILPTHSEGARRVTAYRDAVAERLDTDVTATRLGIFAYAITSTGWTWLGPRLRAWMSRKAGRRIEFFLGLDNDATHPDALRSILGEYPRTSYIVEAPSCFHPKAFLFSDRRGAFLLSGSNNLSGPGLSSNFELGTEFRIEKGSTDQAALDSWVRVVRSCSSQLTRKRIRVYSEEWQVNRTLPRGFRTSGTLRAKTRRHSKAPGLRLPRAAIVEALTETGGRVGRGRQLGLPWAVAHDLFGLKAHSQTLVNAIGPDGTAYLRKMTYFSKVTYRLSIPELMHAQRPCMVVMAREEHPTAAAGVPNVTVRYNVISRKKSPVLFATLFDLCREWPKTRKRWVMFEDSDRVNDLLSEALYP